MDCIVAVLEQPIVFVLLEHQGVPGRKLPLISLFYDLYEGYLLNCAMIIFNSQSKCFQLAAVRGHTAYK
jgi:hypothetical protein